MNNSIAIESTDLHFAGSHAGAEFYCQQLRQLDPAGWHSDSRILVAGCGAGHEAALIHSLLEARVDAIDVQQEWPDELATTPGLDFRVASVCELPFDDGMFDSVFYHHVIEHVDQPAASLDELRRVLRPGGWIFVGTPNRHRLVSSVGAHRQTSWEPTWRNKLGDNINDWSARLRGRFRNELGAHAGFSQKELADMLRASHFAEQRWMTGDYLRFKYHGHRFAAAVNLLASRALRDVAAPSIYVFAR